MEMLPSSWLDSLEGVPHLRRGLLCTNGGGITGAMDWRFTVYLQLSICGLSMARPPSLLIFFLGDTGDGDAVLSPSPSTGGYWSQLISSASRSVGQW